MRVLASAAALLLTLAGSAGLAAAQGAPASASPSTSAATGPTPDQIARAKTLFDLGAKAYESEQYPAAIQAFEEAYRLSQRPGPVFSAAQAYRRLYSTDRKLENLKQAIASYKLYIEKQKSGGRIGEAQQALRDLEPLLADASATPGPAAVTAPAATPTPTSPGTKLTRLMVSSPTKGALASLDGGELSDMPLIQEVTPGPHKLRLAAEGYVDDEREIVAFEGQIYGLDVTLREKPALLTIRADIGATVSVDGRDEGTTPLPKPLELASGTHLVTLSRTGYRPYSAEIDFRRNERRSLDVQLERTTQRYASFVVFGGAAAALAAGGVLTGVALAQEDRAEDLQKLKSERNLTEPERAEHSTAVQMRNDLRIAAVATYGGAALLALVGAGLYVFDRSAPGLPVRMRDESPRRPEATQPMKAAFSAFPIVGPTVGGAVVELRF